MKKERLKITEINSELLVKLRNNDEELFDAIFREYYDSLCRFAYSMIHDEDLAQSLSQAVFVKLWERRFRLQPLNNLPAYLIIMLKHQVWDHFNEEKRLAKYYQRSNTNLEENITENEVFASDFETSLWIAVAKLPNRCRQAFELSRFADLSYREIASEMSISVKGVEALVGRALNLLRKELEEFLPSFKLKDTDLYLFYTIWSAN